MNIENQPDRLAEIEERFSTDYYVLFQVGQTDMQWLIEEIKRKQREIDVLRAEVRQLRRLEDGLRYEAHDYLGALEQHNAEGERLRKIAGAATEVVESAYYNKDGDYALRDGLAIDTLREALAERNAP